MYLILRVISLSQTSLFSKWQVDKLITGWSSTLGFQPISVAGYLPRVANWSHICPVITPDKKVIEDTKYYHFHPWLIYWSLTHSSLTDWLNHHKLTHHSFLKNWLNHSLADLLTDSMTDSPTDSLTNATLRISRHPIVCYASIGQPNLREFVLLFAVVQIFCSYV